MNQKFLKSHKLLLCNKHSCSFKVLRDLILQMDLNIIAGTILTSGIIHAIIYKTFIRFKTIF